MRKTILACALVALVVGATSAAAASLELSGSGARGDRGGKGDAGSKLSSGNWGVINRNTIGSPVVELRSGPFDAPLGDGSLNIAVATYGASQEKAAYGNEVDFANEPLDLTEVGFHVYTTGENNAASPAGSNNMPSITFEIDPNIAAKPATNYSSLVYMPDETASNAWSGYIDATETGMWGLTGGVFNTDPSDREAFCGINGSRCTFDEVMALLGDATILTVGVSKGRDYEFHGAVDGLRINNTVFDFEETGVIERTP